MNIPSLFCPAEVQRRFSNKFEICVSVSHLRSFFLASISVTLGEKFTVSGNR